MLPRPDFSPSKFCTIKAMHSRIIHVMFACVRKTTYGAGARLLFSHANIDADKIYYS